MSGSVDIQLPHAPWWLRRSGALRAGVLVVALVAAAVEVVRVLLEHAGPFPLTGIALGFVGALASRRLPWVGLLATIVGCSVTSIGGWDPIVGWTISVFTLFLVTLDGLRVVPGVIVTGVALFLVVGFQRGAGPASADVLAAVIASIAGGAAGAGLRSQQRYWTELRRRADDAIATRESEARRRVGEERLRIARDLHDLVGHQVAVASMHLGGVEMTVRRDPERAATSAAEARNALRAVTTETQQILELLRTNDDDTDRVIAGLASIEDLVASFARIGLRVDSGVTLAPEPVDPAVGVAAYRVVQEALTNAHRYGDGQATLRIDAGDDRLEIRVANRVGGQGAVTSSGLGLIGMRERVQAAGGTLDVGEAPPDGFQVIAVLPTDGRRLP